MSNLRGLVGAFLAVVTSAPLHAQGASYWYCHAMTRVFHRSNISSTGADGRTAFISTVFEVPAEVASFDSKRELALVTVWRDFAQTKITPELAAKTAGATVAQGWEMAVGRARCKPHATRAEAEKKYIMPRAAFGQKVHQDFETDYYVARPEQMIRIDDFSPTLAQIDAKRAEDLAKADRKPQPTPPPAAPIALTVGRASQSQPKPAQRTAEQLEWQRKQTIAAQKAEAQNRSLAVQRMLAKITFENSEQGRQYTACVRKLAADPKASCVVTR
jgi:hypothetical protein